MVRILTYIWASAQLLILLQISFKQLYISMDLLKIIEIIISVPIILILAKRTRDLKQRLDLHENS